MKSISTTLTIALCGAITIATAALADTAPPANPPAPSDQPATTTGSINTEPTFEQRMADCMAIWEPRTHMTKKEWRRTCKTTLKQFD